MKDFDDFLSTLDPKELEEHLTRRLNEANAAMGRDVGTAGVMYEWTMELLRRYHEWAHA